MAVNSSTSNGTVNNANNVNDVATANSGVRHGQYMDFSENLQGAQKEASMNNQARDFLLSLEQSEKKLTEKGNQLV